MKKEKTEKKGVIAWLDWSASAFSSAKKEGKLVLLSISASWCHWCHTMDKETYADPSVIREITGHFVAVRIDTDKRPDINDRYNLGGWPTTAVLTPQGAVVLGATYLPPDKMRAFLSQARKNPLVSGRVVFRSEELSKENLRDLKDEMLALVKGAFDPQNGGFGVAPKFPQVNVLEFLVYCAREGDKDAREMLVKTLEGMRKGEIHDEEGGGFYRYATQGNWSIPHFEKMLEDNARLARVYLEVFQLTGIVELKVVGKDVLHFVFGMLFDKDAMLFCGSQDADEAFCRLPLKARTKQDAPAIDRTKFTGWNAAMVSSLVAAGTILGEARYVAMAEACFNSLMKANVSGSLPRHFSDGRAPVLFADAAWLVAAGIDLYEATLEGKYRDVAKGIADASIRHFYDANNGGFFDKRESADVGAMSVRKKNLSENVLMSLQLMYLAAITDTENYNKIARESLEMFMSSVASYGFFASDFARAVDVARKGVIVAKLIGKDVKKLHESVLQKKYARLVISHVRSMKGAKEPALVFCEKNICK